MVDTSSQDHVDYVKLLEFMKRVDVKASDELKEIPSPTNRGLVPKIPRALEIATLVLPDGREVELDILNATEGPQCIDGR
jgi:hypothetical protein